MNKLRKVTKSCREWSLSLLLRSKATLLSSNGRVELTFVLNILCLIHSGSNADVLDQWSIIETWVESERREFKNSVLLWSWRVLFILSQHEKKQYIGKIYNILIAEWVSLVALVIYPVATSCYIHHRFARGDKSSQQLITDSCLLFTLMWPSCHFFMWKLDLWDALLWITWFLS